MGKQSRIIKMNQARHLVITPVFRVSFPNLFEARAVGDGAKGFSVDMIFENEAAFSEEYKGKKKQTVSMKKAVFNAKVDQWGKDKAEWPEMRYPCFKEGDTRINKNNGKPYAGYAGNWFATAKSSEKFPPVVILGDGKPATEKDIYGGCYARAQLMARPYDYLGNQGVKFLLLQLMKVKNGERFGGFSSDVFDYEELEEDGEFAGEEVDSDDDF